MSTAPRPPEPQRVGLDNGLRVILAEHRGADVVAVQLWLAVGARHESPDEGGVSHFLEHLLFKGTATRGPGAIDRTIAELGGEMNATTSQDYTFYRVVVPAAHLETAIDVLADAAMHPAFLQDEVERERLVVLEEIRRAHDSPGASVWRLLASCRFRDHPYGRPVLGTTESIRALQRDRIVAHWREHYVPSGAVLVVVGAVEPSRAVDQARRTLGAWEPGPAPRAPGGAPPPARGDRVEERRALGQAYLGVAWTGPAAPGPDVHAVDLLASALGRGRSSRLYQALRERTGLVASVGARYHTQLDAGTIGITARVAPERGRAAETALFEEIARVADQPIGEDELGRALTALEAEHAFAYETAEGAARAYGFAATISTLEFELGYLEAARRVTTADVRAAARRYLVPDGHTTAVLAPEGSP